MDKYKNSPMDLALCQDHIFQKAFQDIDTINKFSKTSVKQYNAVSKLQIYSRDLSISSVDGQQFKTSFEIKKHNFSGCFLDLQFSDKKELKHIINNMPNGVLSGLFRFKFSIILYHNHLVNLTQGKDLCVLLNLFFKKAFNLTQIVYEPKAIKTVLSRIPRTNVGSLLCRLHSKRITSIHVKLNNPDLGLNLYANVEKEEIQIKKNFPCLEKYFIKLTQQVTQTPKFLPKYRALADVISKSNFELMELHFVIMDVRFMPLREDFLCSFKTIGMLENFKFWFVPDRELTWTLTRLDPLIIPKKVVFECSCFIDYASEKPIDFLKHCHALVLQYQPPCTKDYKDGMLDNVLSKLGVMADLKYFEITLGTMVPVIEEMVQVLNYTLYRMVNKIEVLKLHSWDVPFNKIPGNLAKSYPNLKELSLEYHFPRLYSFYCDDYFEHFKHLMVLKIFCPQMKKFTFPPSLKMLIIECKTYKKTYDYWDRSKYGILSSSHFDQMLQEYKSFKCVANDYAVDPEFPCVCQERKPEFRHLVIKQDYYRKCLTCIHFVGATNWEIYLKLIKRESFYNADIKYP